MNRNGVHVYQFRHVFVDDDAVGKYDGVTKSIRIREEFAQHGEKVTAFFRRQHGIFAKVLVGDVALEEVAPLLEFPDEVRAMMTPQLGDLTPEVVAWAKANFPEEEVARRYGQRSGCVEERHEARVMSHEEEAVVYVREGDSVFREGVEVAAIYQDGKQLRMKAGFARMRDEVDWNKG